MSGCELVGRYAASHTYQGHSFGFSLLPGRPAGGSHKDLPSKCQGWFFQVRAWVGQELAQPVVGLHISPHQMPCGVSYSCRSDPSPLYSSGQPPREGPLFQPALVTTQLTLGLSPACCPVLSHILRALVCSLGRDVDATLVVQALI